MTNRFRSARCTLSRATSRWSSARTPICDASGDFLRKLGGVRTFDVAKALLDYGYHAPTVHFPLTVREALMIEPTETESKETLDAFADALLEIADRAKAGDAEGL